MEVGSEDKLGQKEIFSFITPVGCKPSGGPWVVREEFIQSLGIKDVVHPMFTMKKAASGEPSTPPASKKRRMNEETNPEESTSKPRPVNVPFENDSVEIVEVVNAPTLSKTSGAKKKAPKVPKIQRPKKKSPTKKATSSKAGSSKAKPSTPKKTTKKSPNKSSASQSSSTSKGKSKATTKKKTGQKQLTISGFLTPNTSGSQKSSKSETPALTFEQRMEKRALNKSKEIIKKLVTMDTADLGKLLEAVAKSLPSKFVASISNEFVRYLVGKTQAKTEAKNMDVQDRAEYRKQHMHEFELRTEFFWFQQKLKTGKFEDTWLSVSDLPEIPLVVPLDDQETFVKCTRVCTFIQIYRDVLKICKTVRILDLYNALNCEEEGYEKVTAVILAAISEFIRRHQKSIPHFTRGTYLNFNTPPVTDETAQEVARKILFSAYKPSAGRQIEEEKREKENDVPKVNGGVKKSEEDEDESEGEVDEQSKEDDELCEKFTRVDMFKMKPVEQARILELILERAEVSGPIRDSMRNLDGDIKKIGKDVEKIKEKIGKLNDEMEKLPPLIPEELYSEYSRAQTISVIKSNRKRVELEAEVDEYEKQIEEMRDEAMDLRAFTRYRPTSLGLDRFHRRWWFFPPSSGIFVEQGAWTTESTTDENTPLVLPPKKKFHTYDLNTEALVDHLRVLLAGTYPSPSAPVRWFHVNSVDLLDRVMNALAEKGVRESELKAKLSESRELIVATLSTSSSRH